MVIHNVRLSYLVLHIHVLEILFNTRAIIRHNVHVLKVHVVTVLHLTISVNLKIHKIKLFIIIILICQILV